MKAKWESSKARLEVKSQKKSKEIDEPEEAQKQEEIYGA